MVTLLDQLWIHDKAWSDVAKVTLGPRQPAKSRLDDGLQECVKDDVFYGGVWPRVKHSYNPVFQDFVRRLHDEDIDDVPLQN